MRNPVAANATPESDTDINLTPMLDVVFILIIFFLVTASFAREDGLDLNQPDVLPPRPAGVENILISIEEDNLIWMGERLIDPLAVRANIESLSAGNPTATVVIRADRRSSNRILVQVMDASRQAGIDKISLAARQD